MNNKVIKAAGGAVNTSGGTMIVGQRGPQILQVPKNTRVRTNSQYNDATSNKATNNLLSTLINKVDQLIDKNTNVYLDGRLVSQLLIKNKITY